MSLPKADFAKSIDDDADPDKVELDAHTTAHGGAISDVQLDVTGKRVPQAARHFAEERHLPLCCFRVPLIGAGKVTENSSDLDTARPRQCSHEAFELFGRYAEAV